MGRRSIWNTKVKESSNIQETEKLHPVAADCNRSPGMLYRVSDSFPIRSSSFWSVDHVSILVYCEGRCAHPVAMQARRRAWWGACRTWRHNSTIIFCFLFSLTRRFNSRQWRKGSYDYVMGDGWMDVFMECIRWRTKRQKHLQHWLATVLGQHRHRNDVAY
jgi:hypothetical protein